MFILQLPFPNPFIRLENQSWIYCCFCLSSEETTSRHFPSGHLIAHHWNWTARTWELWWKSGLNLKFLFWRKDHPWKSSLNLKFQFLQKDHPSMDKGAQLLRLPWSAPPGPLAPLSPAAYHERRFHDFFNFTWTFTCREVHTLTLVFNILLKDILDIWAWKLQPLKTLTGDQAHMSIVVTRVKNVRRSEAQMEC